MPTRRHRACTPGQAKEGRRMITTMFANLLTSVGVQLAGVPPAALAPLLWSAVLLVGVRRAIRARERRGEPGFGGGRGRGGAGGGGAGGPAPPGGGGARGHQAGTCTPQH